MLVITLWLVTLLSVFAIAVARHLSLELRLTKYQLARARAKALARSGVSLAMQQLAEDAADAEEPYDWLGDDWALPQDAVQTADGAIQVRAIADEERKLDLNAATLEQLQGLTLTADAAQLVVDYRDAEDPNEARATEPPYEPKDGAAVRLEELRDIPGLAADALSTLEQATTPFASDQGASPLNINTVSAEVLVAIAGETLGGQPSASVISALVSARPGPDGEHGTSDDCMATRLEDAANQLAACTQQPPAAFAELLSKATFAASSSTFRIQAEGRTATPAVRVRVEAVVRRTGDAAQPFQVLAWSEG